jgi:cell division transport system permease protein
LSIYLKNDVDDQKVKPLIVKLQKMDNVTDVRFISQREAQANYVAQNKTDPEQLQLLADVTKDNNPFPPSLRLKVRDPGKIQELIDLTKNDEDFKAAISPSPKLQPSFYPKEGEENKKNPIEEIARAASFTEKLGLIASTIFVVISVLIIFNTIRMAIFNRKEEIQMMKLIGADRSFIRGPFIVEAVMYGFFAALVAVGLVYLMLHTIQDKLISYGINAAPTVELMYTYPALILLGTIILGSILGVVSSQLAVRRYLRV